MPANLKGNAKVKLEHDYKAGDEIELAGITFEADQADYERSLRDRLAQQKRQHETEKQELARQLEELKGNQPKPDEQLRLQVERLSNELATTKLNARVEQQLKKHGLSDLPDAYRATIRVKPDASDDELAQAILQAGNAFQELKKELGAGSPSPKPNVGNPGNGGSKDEPSKSEKLHDKAKRLRPDLYKMLDGMPPEQSTEVLQSWDDQGLLATPKK